MSQTSLEPPTEAPPAPPETEGLTSHERPDTSETIARSAVKGSRQKKKKTCFICCLSLAVIVFLGLIGGLVTIIVLRQEAGSGGEGVSSGRIGETSQELTKKNPTTRDLCSDACGNIASGKLESEAVGFARKGSVIEISNHTIIKEYIHVYCDCSESPKREWLVFQRRLNGSVSFNRTMEEFSSGFGHPAGEFWLGLDAISNITTDGQYELRVDLGTWNETTYAEYSTFQVKGAKDHYQLLIGGYKEGVGQAGDSFSYHNESLFCTWDVATEGEVSNECALFHGGGWWFYDCYRAFLNGIWHEEWAVKDLEGIIWETWKGWGVSLMNTEMKMRKIGD